jgi:aquaglyceroporin related protein
MAVWRGFPWRKVPAYWLAQFLGALTGAAIVFADYRKAIANYAGEGVYTVTGANATATLFSTYPAAFMTPEGSFFSEVLGTCILLLVILGQADEHNMHAAKNSPLVVAFTVAAIGMSLGWETGYASKSVVLSFI